MRPRFIVTINDKPVSELFNRRLQSLTLTDHDGDQTDTLDLELADDPEAPLEIPDSRATIRVWGGYDETGVEFLGAFADADVTIECFPHRLLISAKAADMKSGLTSQQERHWDKSSIGGVLTQLAKENGLQAQISPALAGITPPGGYVAMQNESVLGFGQRVAARVGGLFSVKDGKLILAVKGEGTSASGKTLETLTIRPQMIAGRCTAKISGRDRVSKVSADYHDRGAAARKTVTAEGDPGGGAGVSLRHAYGSKAEAERAASARAAALKADAETLSLTIFGDVTVRAGAPFALEGVRPGLDGQTYVVATATHSYAKGGGYTTEIEAKRKAPGAQAEPEPEPEKEESEE